MSVLLWHRNVGVLRFVTLKPETFFTTSAGLCYRGKKTKLTDWFITVSSCRSAWETSYEVTNRATKTRLNVNLGAC